ncbi:MAG TPA: thioesterase family protein [Acidimicrobiales bacterium]
MCAQENNRSLRDAAAVEPLGPGRYGVTISDDYTVVGRPNGGYLQCVLGNAALAAATDGGAPHVHVTSITTNFMSAPSVGRAELLTDVRRVGRGVSFVHVTTEQESVVTTESLVTLGTLDGDSAIRYMDATPPDVAPREQCLRRTVVEEVKIMGVVDFLLDPSSAGWLDGGRSEKGEVLGWLRLDDGASNWDAWSLLFASDGLPPGTFPLGSSGWVPTLQLTTYVRRVPVGEWLRARQWCIVIADDTVDERCELFDERGEMVASSSQLAMVRFPEPR